MSDGLFKKNSIAITISREMALIHGLVEPTPEEASEREAARQEYRRKELEQWRIYDAAREALTTIDDPLARAILDLHKSPEVEFPRCKGCDMEGFEAEQPAWPCRTVEVVFEHYGIPLPDPRYLNRRPTEDQ